MGVYKGLNSNSKLYGIWHGMKQRCNNPKHPLFRLYGAIGITVCEEWKDFQAFQERGVQMCKQTVREREGE